MLGLDVARTRRWCIAWTALLTAGAVAVGGNVGFVGLVVPHGLRTLVGVSHRKLVPAAALGGGAFRARVRRADARRCPRAPRCRSA